MNTKLKKILFVISSIFILIIIICIILFKNNYKTINIGNNNLNKTLEEVEDYILNIKSYTATISVIVNSNKNSNKYIIRQSHKEENDEQEVIEPETIKGVKITYKNSSLKIENSKLNLEKIYNNYPYIESNMLWLNSFIEEYRNSPQRKISELNEDVVMTIKNVDSKMAIKELIIDKKTLKPTTLSVIDNNKKTVVYILYNEIELK